MIASELKELLKTIPDHWTVEAQLDIELETDDETRVYVVGQRTISMGSIRGGGAVGGGLILTID